VEVHSALIRKQVKEFMDSVGYSLVHEKVNSHQPELVSVAYFS